MTEKSEWPIQKSELVTVHYVQVTKQEEIVESQPILDIERYSSYSKLINVTRKVFAFIQHYNKTIKLPSPVMYWLKQAQLKHHSGVFKILRKQLQPLQSDPNTKLIADLGLYLEEGSDVVRSHGRIQHANLPAGTKFPVLLPSNSKISELIILATHMWNKHSRVQDTLIAIRLVLVA